mgnify:CR=1 FL=1
MGKKESKKYKAVGVIIKALDTNRILLLKRSDAHHKFAGHWSIPAGQIGSGENDITALKRETFEETKIKDLKNITYLVSLVNNKTDEQFNIYTADITKENDPQLDFEHTDFMWHTSGELLPEPLGKHMYSILQQQT